MSSFLVDGMGEKLKQARTALGLTQKQLAEKLDVKQSYYSLIEAGKAGIPLSKGPVLFSDLGISEKWFYDSSGEVSDEYMFDTSYNSNTWEAQLKYEREHFEEKVLAKELDFCRSIIKEKDSRIESLNDLINAKDQLIVLLYERIDSFDAERKE